MIPRGAARVVGIAALLAVTSACAPQSASPDNLPSVSASTTPDAATGIIPLLISSEITKGPNRFLFSLTDSSNRLIAAPDVRVALKFYDVDVAENTVVFEATARFLWAIPDAQGLYVADVNFPDAGRWGTRFEATFPKQGLQWVRADYDVIESGTTPALGAAAPVIHTPTADDVGGDLSRLSTDPSPDPRFYETSIAEAVRAGAPFVVTFATPAFCESRMCGPTLATVRDVAGEYPELTFINVEPYKMSYKDGRLQPLLDANNQLQTADWTNAWGLPSEPYTFVVSADGTIAAKFEGVIAPDELRAAIDGL